MRILGDHCYRESSHSICPLSLDELHLKDKKSNYADSKRPCEELPLYLE